MLRRGQDRFRRWMPGLRGGRGLILLLLVVIGIWLLTGFYRVQPDEQGVVLRWGEWTKTTQPGLNYHLPWPFETVITPKVTKVNRAEIGYRTVVDSNRGAFTRPVPDESLMLTGDENIIDVKFTAFWRIRDAGKYLFNIQAPERTVRDAAESAMREVIGKTPPAVGVGRGTPVAGPADSRTDPVDPGLLPAPASKSPRSSRRTSRRRRPWSRPSATCRRRGRIRSGRRTRPSPTATTSSRARAAPRNVLFRRARPTRSRLSPRPRVRRRASSRSTTNMCRTRDVVRRRMYLETMETVLGGIDKILIDSGAQGSSGVVPYLPLPELQRRQDGSQ